MDVTLFLIFADCYWPAIGSAMICYYLRINLRSSARCDCFLLLFPTESKQHVLQTIACSFMLVGYILLIIVSCQTQQLATLVPQYVKCRILSYFTKCWGQARVSSKVWHQIWMLYCVIFHQGGSLWLRGRYFKCLPRFILSVVRLTQIKNTELKIRFE